MPLYLISHEHRPEDCRVAFSAWKDFDSPLRGHRTLSSCLAGGHQLWWRVEAADAEAALAQLPWWIAQKSAATRVEEVSLP